MPGEGKIALHLHPLTRQGRGNTQIANSQLQDAHPRPGRLRWLTILRDDHYVPRMDDPNAPQRTKASVLGTAALVVALLGLLIAAVLFALRSWTSIQGPPLPRVGYLAMTIGVVFSLVIGITLMTLLFYSSRHGYDEGASGDTPADNDGEP